MKFPKLFSVLVFTLLVIDAAGAASATLWQTDLPKAQAQAKAEGKLVLINFTGSDWCGWCIKLRKEVFLKPDFEEYAKVNLVLVEIDFPKRKALPDALQKANHKLAEQFEVQGYPTLIVLNGQGTKLGRVSYGSGGAKSFLADLAKVTRPQPEPPTPSVPAKKSVELRRADKASPSTRTNLTDLTLRKITGSKQRRQAVINGQLFSAGEIAKLRLATGVVKVHCVEIRERSVIVTVNGPRDKRELRLAEGT